MYNMYLVVYLQRGPGLPIQRDDLPTQAVDLMQDMINKATGTSGSTCNSSNHLSKTQHQDSMNQCYSVCDDFCEIPSRPAPIRYEPQDLSNLPACDDFCEIPSRPAPNRYMLQKRHPVPGQNLSPLRQSVGPPPASLVGRDPGMRQNDSRQPQNNLSVNKDNILPELLDTFSKNFDLILQLAEDIACNSEDDCIQQIFSSDQTPSRPGCRQTDREITEPRYWMSYHRSCQMFAKWIHAQIKLRLFSQQVSIGQCWTVIRLCTTVPITMLFLLWYLKYRTTWTKVLQQM